VRWPPEEQDRRIAAGRSRGAGGDRHQPRDGGGQLLDSKLMVAPVTRESRARRPVAAADLARGNRESRPGRVSAAGRTTSVPTMWSAPGQHHPVDRKPNAGHRRTVVGALRPHPHRVRAVRRRPRQPTHRIPRVGEPLARGALVLPDPQRAIRHDHQHPQRRDGSPLGNHDPTSTAAAIFASATTGRCGAPASGLARVRGSAPRTIDIDIDGRRPTIPRRGRPITNREADVDKRRLMAFVLLSTLQ
jgi:hypothetical protein